LTEKEGVVAASLLVKSNASTKADKVGVLSLEDEAVWAEGVMGEIRYKSVEILPTLQHIHTHFISHKRGSIKFRGCKSWTEYCKQRLHCTPDAIFMMEKRLRLKDVAKEKAKAAAAKKRQNARWLREIDARLAEESRSPASIVNGLHIAKAPINSSVCEYETDDDDNWVPIAAPLAVLKDLLSVTDETVMALHKIMDTGLLAEVPDLLESTRLCATNAAKIAADVRKDYGLTDGKIINIADAQRTS
jgi:hypothetical protein